MGTSCLVLGWLLWTNVLGNWCPREPIGPLVHWSIGPLVHWSLCLLVHWLNVKCQKSNVKCQMPKVHKLNLLSERTSGAPPVFFSVIIARVRNIIIIIFVLSFHYCHHFHHYYHCYCYQCHYCSGEYDCQVSTTPPIAVTVFLNVKGEISLVQDFICCQPSEISRILYFICCQPSVISLIPDFICCQPSEISLILDFKWNLC